MKNDRGEACGTGEVHTGFWLGDLMKRNNLEDLGVDGKITLKCIFSTGVGRHRLDCSGSG
jgi:hypothetical protein